MKRLFALLSAIAIVVSSFAQTPEEIVSRMEAQMDGHKKEGMAMTVDTKIPILGTITARTWALDNKMRMETKVKDIRIIVWTDGQTDWTYNSSTNEVKITKSSGSSMDSAGDAEMFDGITDGYDVSIEKETDDAWYILCKKSKSNTNKDDPKTVNLVVGKGDYHPISLSAKLSGITMTMRELNFGVSEKTVTFNAEDYPGVTVEDKR